MLVRGDDGHSDALIPAEAAAIWGQDAKVAAGAFTEEADPLREVAADVARGVAADFFFSQIECAFPMDEFAGSQSGEPEAKPFADENVCGAVQILTLPGWTAAEGDGRPE